MKFFDLRARFSFVSAIVVLLASAAAGQDIRLSNELSKSFSKFEIVRIASSSTESLSGDGKRLRLKVDGKTLDLDITPNDLRGPTYRAENTGPAGNTRIESGSVNTFKGKVAGRADSEVRLTIDGSKTEGYFLFDGARFFIEPARKYSAMAAEGDSVVYKAEDSLVDNSFACEADTPTRIKMGDGMLGSMDNAVAAGPMRRFEIATEADFEYVNQLGGASAANAEILSILNMVEGTYSPELGLRIRVTFQHTWTVADPYAGSGANAILTNFLNHWNANYPTSAGYWRNAAHLFTAKSNALSQGLAYVGVICQNLNFSYGLSGYISWAPGKYLIPAHELGHNLGGQHVDAAQSCANSIMNAQLSGSTPMSFCSYSQNQMNTYIATSGGCMAQITDAKRFDFDGDNRADISVFRPSEGKWYVRKSGGGDSMVQFGLPGDVPVTADYDGDAKSDAVIFRNGVWWRLLSATNTVDSMNFGLAGDIPVPANFDTDGKADVAVFRPSSGQWFWIRSANWSVRSVSFGLNGDVPLPADFDGDSIADINVFRPSNGTWYRINSSNASVSATQWGLAGDQPLLADFDGDSKSDIAVWRPSTGEWYMIRSSDFGIRQYTFGLTGDVPAVGDFDGDGRSELSVYRPSNGTWYRVNSSNWQFVASQYGLTGDKPAPSYYVQ